MATVNRPVNRLGPEVRHAVGLLALGNLAFAAGLLMYALVG